MIKLFFYMFPIIFSATASWWQTMVWRRVLASSSGSWWDVWDLPGSWSTSLSGKVFIKVAKWVPTLIFNGTMCKNDVFTDYLVHSIISICCLGCSFRIYINNCHKRYILNILFWMNILTLSKRSGTNFRGSCWRTCVLRDSWLGLPGPWINLDWWSYTDIFCLQV